MPDTQTHYLPCTYGRAAFTNTGKMASRPYQEILLDFSASDVYEVIFLSVTVAYCFISNAPFVHTEKKITWLKFQSTLKKYAHVIINF